MPPELNKWRAAICHMCVAQMRNSGLQTIYALAQLYEAFI